jgi:CP family cyanate transporter-like MFS transporter
MVAARLTPAVCMISPPPSAAASNPTHLNDDLVVEAVELPPSPSRARSRALLVTSLMLLAFNLRPSLSGVGPVLPEIIRDVGLSTVGASLLTTLPVLCLGVFSPVAPWLGRRLGVERAILAFLVVLTVGTVLRGVPGELALFTGSILIGIGISIINVLVPGLIKRDFGGRAALMMGVHSMMLCAGGTLAAAVAVPLEQALDGSWAIGFALWGLPALAAVLLWLPHLPRRVRYDTRAGYRVRGLWRNRLAWQVSLFMAFQSAVFYAGISWLPPILRERGLTPQEAGLAISIAIFVQLGSSMAAPPLAALGRDQRPAVLISEFLLAVGVIGFLFAPLSMVWGLAVVFGLGQGALFALALTMIVLRSRDAHVAAQLSSMVQGIGYTIASGGSLVTGLVYGMAGGREAVGVLFILLLLAGSISGWGAGRNALVEASVESRGS